MVNKFKEIYKISEVEELCNLIDDNGGGDFFGKSQFSKMNGLTIIDLSEYPPPKNIDPLSYEYHNYQIQLYEKISGRKYEPFEGEKNDFFKGSILAPNGYTDNISHNVVMQQIKTIANCFILGELSEGNNILDMGSGVGVSTELMATSGLQVDSYDIEKAYLENTRLRAKNRGYNINTIHGNFDDLKIKDKYNMILFFECFHHSCNTKNLLKNLVDNHLKDDGCIILSGEPITDRDWGSCSWGIDLAPQAIYCIRKYGWFETNFSSEYLLKIFDDAGLDVMIVPGIGHNKGVTVIGIKKTPKSSEIFKRKIETLIPINYINPWPEKWRGGIKFD
jgi:2-polyprenyl-3-methyl-5-hydroxy-6-metoxy-1,4-benzoquinol methylase